MQICQICNIRVPIFSFLPINWGWGIISAIHFPRSQHPNHPFLYPPRLNQGLVILSLFFVSIFFPTTPSPCINGYTGYVEFSLSILLLVRLGQNEHPKSLLFSKTSDHVSELTCNKITVYPRELYIAKAAENCGFSLVVPIISRTPTKDISPPYVKSGTTLWHKKRAFDFSKTLFKTILFI